MENLVDNNSSSDHYEKNIDETSKNKELEKKKETASAATSVELTVSKKEDKENNTKKKEEKNLVLNSNIEGQFQSKVNTETIFQAIEDGFPKVSKSSSEYAFPHPRYWIGPRYMAIWSIPIFAITKTRELLKASNPIRPYSESNYSVKKYETIHTSTQEALSNSGSMRFFGARFLTIWVLPLAFTGTVMEFLFISPMTGVKPFG